MEMTVSWTKEDIERKLREELEESGFRIIEAESTADEPAGDKKKRRKAPRTFRWKNRPDISVSVRAEPDPDAVFPEPEPESSASSAAEDGDTEDDASEENEDSLQEIPEGTGFLPPGAATAINKAVREEKAGRSVKRRRMTGESDERPD